MWSAEEIVHVKTEKLIPYYNNPKEHPPEQIDKIASSIKHFGFTIPIVVDGQNEIIAGNGRFEAAKKLGLEEVPCIVRDDLTEAEIRAFRIADNKVAESGWDAELLAAEMEALEAMELDLGLTGFELEEIEGLLYPAEPLALEGEEEKDWEDRETYRCPKCGFEFEVRK